uniref:Uncharacterized protein n=1 Tax=Oryza barthii TaxID=65489 RepID=A0A0D3GJW5_9ORYZ
MVSSFAAGRGEPMPAAPAPAGAEMGCCCCHGATSEKTTPPSPLRERDEVRTTWSNKDALLAIIVDLLSSWKSSASSY